MKLSSEAEVSNLDLQVLIEKEVAELQVSVQDSVLGQLHVLESGNYLLGVVFTLEFCQTFTRPYQIGEGLVTAKLEK